MALVNTESTAHEQTPPVADRIADAVRHAAHVSHETQMVTSMARDAAEVGLHAAKRAMKQVTRQVGALEDMKDDAARYVRRQPLKALGIAAGVGLLAGVVIGWIGRCPVEYDG